MMRSNRASAPRTSASNDQREREAVVPLATYCLDRRGADARLGREHLVETAYPLDPGVIAVGIDHLPLADDVIDDDQAAAARQLHRPGEVFRGAHLVGVDEH